MNTANNRHQWNLVKEDLDILNQLKYLSHHSAVFYRLEATETNNPFMRIGYANIAETREDIARLCGSFLANVAGPVANDARLLAQTFVEASRTPGSINLDHQALSRLATTEKQTMALFRQCVKALDDRSTAQLLADKVAHSQIAVDSYVIRQTPE